MMNNTYVLLFISVYFMASRKKTQRKRSNEMSKKKSATSKTPIITVIVLIAVISIAAGTFFIMTQPSNDGTNTQNSGSDTGDSTENPIAVINTSMGIIKVELFKDKVPNTVNNFISYAEDGFYDGLVFHRVIDDFMIQGGGFKPDGSKKETRDPIDLEINKDVRHVDGAIAMARTSDPNSATSQFYICDGAQSFLDDNYAVFGVTIEGIDVVRNIASVETTTKHGMQDWPVEDIIIYNIRIEE